MHMPLANLTQLQLRALESMCWSATSPAPSVSTALPPTVSAPVWSVSIATLRPSVGATQPTPIPWPSAVTSSTKNAVAMVAVADTLPSDASTIVTRTSYAESGENGPASSLLTLPLVPLGVGSVVVVHAPLPRLEVATFSAFTACADAASTVQEKATRALVPVSLSLPPSSQRVTVRPVMVGGM